LEIESIPFEGNGEAEKNLSRNTLIDTKKEDENLA